MHSQKSDKIQNLTPTKSAIGKVEKILKDSLFSIPSPSPSVKIQIIGGKVCLRCKGNWQNIAGRCQQTFWQKVC